MGASQTNCREIVSKFVLACSGVRARWERRGGDGGGGVCTRDTLGWGGKKVGSVRLASCT